MIPMTDRNSQKKFKKFDLNSDIDQMKTQLTLQTPSSKNSFRDFMNSEYYAQRDPMKEFFILACQSVKINSPHMNIICTINQNTLYEKAIAEGIPFFKWYSWIENTINKEVLQIIFRDKKKYGNQ